MCTALIDITMYVVVDGVKRVSAGPHPSRSFALWLTLLAAVGSMAEAVLTLRRIRR